MVKVECEFLWQAQYLLKVDCDISWQAQHSVKFFADSRSATCCIFQYRIVSKIRRVRSRKRQVRDDDFLFGSCSDHARNVFESSLYWRKQFNTFPLQS